MLEVLDPAQNDTFRDHYLDLEFDLSEVIFIATANMLDTIPGPLLDRMETIELAGYTLDEKQPHRPQLPGRPPDRRERAEAVPDRVRRRGADRDHRGVHPRGRRAQPRAPDRHRSAAKSPARSPRARPKRKVTVSGKKARELLGRRRVFAEQRRRTKVPGVATGLAWTPTGGDVLFIEATAMPGSGELTITGQLGDVMKESAQAALSYVRGHGREIAPKLGEDWFAEHDIHIHVPAGAVPKDGPSAGVAMTVALSSLISGRPVRNDVAMTGEVTLTGQVLPIGGLEGEVAGGAAGGDQAGDRARAQRGRRRRRFPSTSSVAWSSSSSTRSRRRSTSPSPNDGGGDPPAPGAGRRRVRSLARPGSGRAPAPSGSSPG